MNPKKLNKLLASIVKSREILKNIVQDRSLEPVRPRDYAEKLIAPILEAEDKNTNMINDKLHENDTN